MSQIHDGTAGASDVKFQTWSPPTVRCLPLDLTGSQNLSAGSEHTAGSWISPLRQDPNPMPAS